MTTSLYSVDSFHKLVREMVQESIKEEMLSELKRLNLKELGGVIGTQDSSTTQASTGTSGETETTGTKSGVGPQPGNNDPANNVMVPGTNLSLNAGLQAASKEQNFKRKAQLIKKIADQLSGMSGVVVKEQTEQPEEWALIHRAIQKSLRAVSKDYSKLFDELEAKAPRVNPNKAIRALEDVLSNNQQMLQMSKNVNNSKVMAAKVIAKSPLAKRYFPVILGGDLDTTNLTENKLCSK